MAFRETIQNPIEVVGACVNFWPKTFEINLYIQVAFYNLTTLTTGLQKIV